ncbi:MAG: 8-amino-7-oxononanoate synthase [Thermodesulfobacteriota bacterium]|nr:8-amino-7-oxononanoate synthase [Thermodesulfobacteriota bacterium]
MSKLDFIEAELEKRRAASRLRTLRPVAPAADRAAVTINGARLLNVCSNDYLGLSRHPLLVERAQAFAAQWGAGATASRLICGNYTCFDRVEEKLSRLKQTPAALVLNSGYQANTTLLPALCDRNSLILSDRLNHNSIIMGCRLARCAVRLFDHNDPVHLEKLLTETAGQTFSRRLIVTESVFSMDGDCCDMDALAGLAQAHDALLMVDEAHATGVFGEKGMGLTCGKPVDVVMGTFGKGCGSFGAYVACSSALRDFFVNRCAGFVYSTGLPPAVLGAIDAALDLVPAMDAERQTLLDNAAHLRARLAALGFDTGASSSQILPVIVGSEQAAIDLSRFLETQGFLAVAIRPPTVPEAQSRIRVSLSALHTRNDVDRLADAFGAWRRP